jgi:hypothetical protein
MTLHWTKDDIKYKAVTIYMYVCVCVCVSWSLSCVACGASFSGGSWFGPLPGIVTMTQTRARTNTYTHTYIYIYIYIRLLQILGAPQLQSPGTTDHQNSWLQNEWPGTIPGWGVIFLFTPGPSKTLIRWLPTYTSLEAKRPGCEADNSSATIILGSGKERTWEARVKASRFLPTLKHFTPSPPLASVTN